MPLWHFTKRLICTFQRLSDLLYKVALGAWAKPGDGPPGPNLLVRGFPAKLKLKFFVAVFGFVFNRKGCASGYGKAFVDNLNSEGLALLYAICQSAQARYEVFGTAISFYVSVSHNFGSFFCFWESR